MQVSWDSVGLTWTTSRLLPLRFIVIRQVVAYVNGRIVGFCLEAIPYTK